MALRSFSALLGISTIPATYRVAGRWLGERAALAASFLVAVSPIHVYYSWEARSYALLTLLSLLSAHGCVSLVRGGGRSAWGLYVGATLTALYTHYWSFFLLVFENLYFIASCRWGGKAPPRRQWFAAQAVILLLFVPWAPIVVEQFRSGAGAWIRPPPPDVVAKSLYRFSAGYLLDQILPFYRWLAVVPCLGLYVPLLFFGSVAREDPSAGEEPGVRLAFVAYLFVPLLAAFLFSRLIAPAYVVGRYDMVVFPAFVLLAGRGLSRLEGWKLRLVVSALVVWLIVYLGAFWSAVHP